MVTNPTTILLEAVVDRLSFVTDSVCITTSDVMSKSNNLAIKLREQLVKSVRTGSTKPDVLSRAFAATHGIFTTFYACATSDEDDPGWPYGFSYDGNIHVYCYKNFVLEVSILKEINENASFEYCYLCTSFPHIKHAYNIEEIPINCIPSLEESNEENDMMAIAYLARLIGRVFDTFIGVFVKKGKMSSREFSSRGLLPIFPRPCVDKSKTGKKRRVVKNKKAVEEPDMSRFKLKVPDFYISRCTLLENSDSPPNPCQRLLALIIDILICSHACRIHSKGEWPEGSSIIMVLFPKVNVASEVNCPGVPNVYYSFNMSLLRNEKEFFFSLRYVNDLSKKCIKKLDATLVPEFTRNNPEKDLERLENLNVWMSAIQEKFVQKVIAQAYSSNDVSFVSLENTRSGTPSADEDRNEEEPMPGCS